MSENDLRQQLYDSFKNRAIVYYLIYDEMRRRLGPESAEAIVGAAIDRRGRQLGQRLARFGPADLGGLEDAFLSGIPDDGQMFAPRVVGRTANALDIEFHRCPLRDAWQELGLADDEVATICRIAARVDSGMFEAAGFGFSADTWQPGSNVCCQHIRPGNP